MHHLYTDVNIHYCQWRNVDSLPYIDHYSIWRSLFCNQSFLGLGKYRKSSKMDPFRQGYYFLADFVSDYRLINYSPMCSLQVSIRSASILQMCGVTCIRTTSSWCYFYQHHNIMLAILKTLSALNCMKAIISYLFCAPSVIFFVLKYPY